MGSTLIIVTKDPKQITFKYTIQFSFFTEDKKGHYKKMSIIKTEI